MEEVETPLSKSTVKMSGRALIHLSRLVGRSAKAAANGQMGGQAEALQTVRDMAVVLPQRLDKFVEYKCSCSSICVNHTTQIRLHIFPPVGTAPIVQMARQQ